MRKNWGIELAWGPSYKLLRLLALEMHFLRIPIHNFTVINCDCKFGSICPPTRNVSGQLSARPRNDLLELAIST